MERNDLILYIILVISLGAVTGYYTARFLFG